MMIGLRMAPWQIDIFIHVEGLDVLKTDFSGLEIFHKFGIHFQRSSSSWQTFKNEKFMNRISSKQKLKKENLTQNKVFVFAWLEFVDALDDILGGPLTNFDIIVQDDKPHFQSKNWQLFMKIKNINSTIYVLN